MVRFQNFGLPIFCLLVLVLLSGCELFLGPALVGSGILMIEEREIEPFTQVEVAGAIEADVARGDVPFVEISGDDNVVPIVITEVRGQTLVVRTAYKGRVKQQHGIKVRIETPEFNRADVSGACEVDIEGFDSETVVLDVSGASDVSISGACRKLVADLSGACDLDAEQLAAAEVRVDASGASSAKVHAHERLVADASGASNIEYLGNPTSIKADKSGASSVDPANRD